ncbi:uncharacterized protein LOC100378285 [Saccoglossus kowalevskii]|uniref:Surfeit locus protein 6 homolog n=1 Tax=Saccoglossus kowalevskii TaxID=10224 RepID=A0ABM0GW51_SACKO|nr:PREDICTED: surfeit locus protein 6 homolog [Saccoglossus kowalevskii]
MCNQLIDESSTVVTIMTSTSDSLRTRLEERNNYFNRMINLIPVEVYFDQEDQQKKDPAANQDESKASKKGKRKRQRLDPKHHKNVTDIQKEMDENEETAIGGTKEEDSSDEDDGDKKSKMAKPINVEQIQSNLSLNELRTKLQNKILGMKGKRKASDDGTDKQIKKQRRLDKKMKEKKKKEFKENASRNNSMKMLNNKIKLNKENGQKPIVNNEGKVVFSKFDFSESLESKDLRKKKKKQNISNKNVKALLRQVEMKKEKFNEMKEKDPEKAKNVEQKQAWKKAMQKAEGVKLKDDPELLKKSIKKREQIKKRNKKQWDERKVVTEKLIKKRQDKRKKNIKSRKDHKLQKKMKVMKKKGRILPGF